MAHTNVRTLVGARTVALALIIGGAAAAAAAAPQPSPRSTPTIGEAVVITRAGRPQAPSADAVSVTSPKGTLWASTASVTTQPGRDRVGTQALALIRVDWRPLLPGWRIEFKAARVDHLAMTYPWERRIEVFVRPERSIAALAHDVAHELGHAIDVTHNDENARAKYLSVRGLRPDTPWWTCARCTDFEVGAGDFAEMFARFAAPGHRFLSTLGPEPNAEQLATYVEFLVPHVG